GRPPMARIARQHEGGIRAPLLTDHALLEIVQAVAADVATLDAAPRHVDTDPEFAAPRPRRFSACLAPCIRLAIRGSLAQHLETAAEFRGLGLCREAGARDRGDSGVVQPADKGVCNEPFHPLAGFETGGTCHCAGAQDASSRAGA